MLKMKKKCERCEAKTGNRDLAFICSFECTFCEKCTNDMSRVCPNCDGELLERPKRLRKPIQVAVSQVKKNFGEIIEFIKWQKK